MAYIITISVAAMLIALGNFLFEGVYTLAAFLLLLLWTVAEVAAVIVIDGVLAFLVRRLPEGWFSHERRFFSVPAWEGRLYRRLGIAKWKKFVPELGCFTGFHKDTLREPRSSKYIGRFLLESNYGVVGHVLGALGGFLLLLLPKRKIGLFVAIVNFVLNMMPTAILRTNTPALLRIYKRNLRREESANAPDAGMAPNPCSKFE